MREQPEERAERMAVGEEVGGAPGDVGPGLVAVDGTVGPEERAVVLHAQEGDVGVDGTDPLPEPLGGHAGEQQLHRRRVVGRPYRGAVLELSTGACRVLGSLLEKEVTVPSTYPLTMNGLVAACNQTTSRDPVLALTEAEVTAALAELRATGLTRLVHASHGARTVKYRQVADEVWALEGGSRAVLTVLLLRGPQTPGELRARGERLHAFASVDEVHEVLQELADRPEPLVARRPRGPGQKEHTWAHLVGGPADAPDVAAATPAPEPTAPVAVPPRSRPWRPSWAPGGAVATAPTPPSSRSATPRRSSSVRCPASPCSPTAPRRGPPPTAGRCTASRASCASSGDGAVELVVAQGSGLVELAEGLLDDHELVLASTGVVGTGTAKRVDATERRYHVEGDTLTYELAMAAVGQPLLPHLKATLHRA